MTPWQNEFHWRPSQKNIFGMRARAILGSFILALATLLLWRRLKGIGAPHKHRAERRAAPTVERSPPPGHAR